MKNKFNVILIIMLLSLMILSFLGYNSLDNKIKDIEQYKKDKETKEILIQKKDSIRDNKLDSINNNPKKLLTDLKPINKFLHAMGFAESTNNYNAVNSYGFIGKYQFGASALVEAKVCKNIQDAKIFRDLFISTEDTLKNNIWSNLAQETAMKKLIQYNKRTLRKYIAEHKNTFLYTLTDTIYITESGIIAAAHLAGCGNVQKFFTDINHGFKDGYGTTIETYLNKFKGYKV